MDLFSASALYVFFLAALFLGLWLFYDRRSHARFDAERRKTAFHCIRCNELYARAQGTEFAPCPRCGHENARLKF